MEDLVDLEDVTNMVDSEIEELAAYLKSQICQVERGNSQAVLVSMTLAPRGSPNSITLRVPRPLQVIYNPVILREIVKLFAADNRSDTLSIDVSRTKKKISDAAAAATQASWHLHADIMTPVFILPGDCSVDRGPCAALDFGRLEVDVHHGGQYPPPEYPDIEGISERSNGLIQLPKGSDVHFSSTVRVKMSGMQLLVSEKSVNWTPELAQQDNDLRLVPKCTVSIELSAFPGAW